MEGTRFDRMARAMATSGSRRRVLAALLAGALGNLRLRTAMADEERGMVIADASGGDLNRATVTDPATTGNDRDNDRDNDTQDRKPCQPDSKRERCEGRCDIVVNDGCGGEFTCNCDGDKVCARDDAVCCSPERLCDDKRLCCQGEDVCGPGDACCPPERLCIPSDVCCSAGKVCAPGGGVCCRPEQVCTVGGVANACCTGTCNNAGVCV